MSHPALFWGGKRRGGQMSGGQMSGGQTSGGQLSGGQMSRNQNVGPVLDILMSSSSSCYRLLTGISRNFLC